jgi:hypothetical protein
MTIIRFIRNNLIYYLRKNLLLAAGIAISGAVLTGALLVGDSVKYSLNRIVELRLGNVTHVIQAGDRYFTSELTDRVGGQLNVPVSSILLQEGWPWQTEGPSASIRYRCLALIPVLTEWQDWMDILELCPGTVLSSAGTLPTG